MKLKVNNLRVDNSEVDNLEVDILQNFRGNIKGVYFKEIFV